MPGWMKHKLKSGFLGETSVTSDMHATTTLIFLGEISITSDIHDTIFHRKRRETTELLDESEKGE